MLSKDFGHNRDNDGDEKMENLEEVEYAQICVRLPIGNSVKINRAFKINSDIYQVSVE